MRLPHVRFTVRRTMIAVACLGVIIGIGRFYFLRIDPFLGLGTTYSERYSENRFKSLRVGMTREEVIAVLGQPLDKVPWNDGALENWWYSVPPHSEANYWRRWVFFEQGKVAAVVNDFWVD